MMKIKNKCNANAVGAGLAFGKSEELIVNNEEYKCFAFDVGAGALESAQKIKKQNAITLIALIITIIIMLILAGVVLNLTLGEHGIFKTAKDATSKYSEQEAREKLELVLFNMQAEKVTNSEYNENEYLTKKIEENGMKVNENIVTVGNYKFEIDRSVPRIEKSLGKFDNNEEITTKKKALVLDGDTYIDTNLQESEFIKTDGNFTIAARVKINRVGQQSVNYMNILGNHSTGVGYVWQFEEQTTRLNIGGNFIIDYTPYYDQWVDIVATYESSNYKVYVNGMLLNEEEEVSFTPYGKFLIGTGYSLTDRRMKGMIASVKLWDEKLNEEEVRNLSLLIENTKIKSDNIKLEVILDSMEDVNNIGTVIGNSRFETRNFALEYSLRFLGGSCISTTWNESEIFNESRQWTIASRIKINRAEQTSIAYMNILGNHENTLGYTWQFADRTSMIIIYAIGFDYTPYYDQWVDLFVTSNKENMKIYVNGELIASENLGEGFSVTSYNNFFIGTGYLKSDRTMRGSIASVKMWKIDLTQEEIRNINMLAKENIQQENIVNNVILESNETISQIGTMAGSGYTYTLRH